MSDFYNGLQATASRLIREKGQAITISRATGDVYDPLTQTVTPGITQNQTITALVLPATKGTVLSFAIKFEKGTLIETNIRSVKASAADFDWMPMPGDTVIISGEQWIVIGSTPLSPGGVDLIYSFSVRR
jgi:hypothetical protein